MEPPPGKTRSKLSLRSSSKSMSSTPSSVLPGSGLFRSTARGRRRGSLPEPPEIVSLPPEPTSVSSPAPPKISTPLGRASLHLGVNAESVAVRLAEGDPAVRGKVHVARVGQFHGVDDCAGHGVVHV